MTEVYFNSTTKTTEEIQMKQRFTEIQPASVFLERLTNNKYRNFYPVPDSINCGSKD